MKRVLVIGASSYIGRSFKEYVDHLHAEDGWEIDLVGARNEEWKALDFQGYDTVLHAAAIVHQREAGGYGGRVAYRRGGKAAPDREMYRRVNYETALAVAAKAKDCSVQQFVFISTIAVYGKQAERITKDTKAKPDTFYGIYKHMAEKDLQKFQSKSFDIVIVRPPMVYGEDCKGNFVRLAKMAVCCPVFPQIANKRSMIYIDNLCEYLYLAIGKEIAGLGCPQNKEYVQTTDLYKKIRAAKGKKTFSITIFNPMIKHLIKKIGFLDKLFGDCYYDSEQTRGRWLDIGLEEYHVVGYEESIERSVRRSKGNYL